MTLINLTNPTLFKKYLPQDKKYGIYKPVQNLKTRIPLVSKEYMNSGL
tara:strand:- start:43 stop:186 length:144 start_codon:yes stop_codon:yes gene_type:complete